GRWIKPDVVKGKLINPQSLNRNIYGQNRPLFFIDIDGNDVYVFFWDPVERVAPSGHVGIAVELHYKNKLQYYSLHPEGSPVRSKADKVNEQWSEDEVSQDLVEYDTERPISPDETIIIKTEAEWDKEIKEIFDEVFSEITHYSIYLIFGDNCASAASKSLKSIGMDLGTKITPKSLRKALKRFIKKQKGQETRKRMKASIERWHEEQANEFIHSNSVGSVTEEIRRKTSHE
ncbi:hypothetical protein KAU32_07550, partial [bacterium]|nr:hypothetical protein [bacterium]